MLELFDLGHRYPETGWVFRHVSLEVPAGSVTVVLGPNGRGKTTLVRCAAGLLKPEEGSVSHDEPVGFVPQARGGAFAYRAVDMVVMGRVRQVSLFGSPTRDDRVAANDAMERIGVGHLAERQFPTLSGGEQQLVLIARAIASESPALVLDEPTTGLDLYNQAQIMSLLRKLVADGMSVLLTTHHPDHALYLADTVVLMGGPDAVTYGSASELLTESSLSRLYDIDVRIVTYLADGAERRAVVTGYGGDLDRR
ncbi:MAG: ABC transporter ATP-binding protein [Aeromicrobium sp.]